MFACQLQTLKDIDNVVDAASIDPCANRGHEVKADIRGELEHVSMS